MWYTLLVDFADRVLFESVSSFTLFVCDWIRKTRVVSLARVKVSVPAVAVIMALSVEDITRVLYRDLVVENAIIRNTCRCVNEMPFVGDIEVEILTETKTGCPFE